MSDTPRTDAAQFRIMQVPSTLENLKGLPMNAVPADFARTLERELTERTRERDEARELAQSNLDAYREARDQRDALRAEVERLRGAVQEAVTHSYNPFEPDNQGAHHKRMLAALTPAEVTK